MKLIFFIEWVHLIIIKKKKNLYDSKNMSAQSKDSSLFRIMLSASAYRPCLAHGYISNTEYASL